MGVMGRQIEIVGEWPQVACGLSAARDELGLDQREFELAVQLGEVRTVPGERRGTVGEHRMVARAELERLRAEDGFPSTLRDRLRLVGTVAGAEALGVSRDRFGKLARAGCFRPARWYVNRYQAVVWLYLAHEVREFGALNPHLLARRLPSGLRARIEAGGDLRARGWRSRCVERLVADATDAWQEAAVWAALLGPQETARVAPDRREREHLHQLLPALSPGKPGIYAPRAVVEAHLLADDAEEIMFAVLCLGHALERARTVRPLPWASDLPAPPEPAVSRGRNRPRRPWLRLLHGTGDRRVRTRRSTQPPGPVAER
jgi:hypothetical protein